MVKIEHPLSKNMELVSTHDLNGQPGFQMAFHISEMNTQKKYIEKMEIIAR